MADQPLHLRPDADLEAALRDLAGAIDWPAAGPTEGAGPDLATAVRIRIDAERPARRRSRHPVRRALIFALIALLAIAAVAGAAGLGLPGLRLIFGSGAASPPPSVSPGATASAAAASAGPSARAPGSTMDLGEQIDLADLETAAGFAVALPADPALGAPDAAYVDASKGGQVALVWAARDDLPATVEPGVGLVLTAFDAAIDGGYFTKILSMDGTTVEPVLVDGERAYWVGGDPHFLYYERPGGRVEDARRWVGDALLWVDDGITYRIETSLGQARAIEIAESMP